MKKLVAHPLPLDVERFTLPVAPDAEVLGLFETEGFYLWTIDDTENPGKTDFIALRDGDEVPGGVEFVVAGQRRGGAVILLFTEGPKPKKAG